MGASSWCTVRVFFMVPPVKGLQLVLHERVSVAACSPWHGHEGAYVRSSWRLVRVPIGGQRVASPAVWNRFLCGARRVCSRLRVRAVLGSGALACRIHRQRPWCDSGTAGRPPVRAFRAMQLRTRCGSYLGSRVFNLRVVLCGVWVSMTNLNLIGVIYGSGGSGHLSGSTRGKLVGAGQSAPRAGSYL